MWAIIAANVAAFLYQLSLSEQELQWFLYQHALVPRRYFFPAWGESNGLSPLDLTPFLTNTFLHGGLLQVLGASGAIAGVIAAYAVRFPYAWVRVIVPILFIPLFFSIPAMVFAGLWFFMQVLQGATDLMSPFGAAAGIAWWAHIGGLEAGFLLLPLLEAVGRHRCRPQGLVQRRAVGARAVRGRNQQV